MLPFIISIVSTGGGTGKSFIARELCAYISSCRSGNGSPKILLADMDLYNGCQDIVLGIPKQESSFEISLVDPNLGVEKNLLQLQQRLNSSILKYNLKSSGIGFDLLPAMLRGKYCFTYEDTMLHHTTWYDTFLQYVEASVYTFIIVDMSEILSHSAFKILMESDAVVFVATPLINQVASMAQTIQEYMKIGLDVKKVKSIINMSLENNTVIEELMYDYEIPKASGFIPYDDTVREITNLRSLVMVHGKNKTRKSLKQAFEALLEGRHYHEVL